MKSQKGFCWLRKRTDDMFTVVIVYGMCGRFLI